MAGWTNNDRPPVPQGAAGAARQERGIVPRAQAGGQGEKNARPSLLAGAFFCALGGAVASSTLSFVGPAFVGYGYLAVAPAGGVRARVSCLAAALVPAVALALAGGVSAVVSSVVACLAALAVSRARVVGPADPGRPVRRGRPRSPRANRGRRARRPVQREHALRGHRRDARRLSAPARRPDGRRRAGRRRVRGAGARLAGRLCRVRRGPVRLGAPRRARRVEGLRRGGRAAPRLADFDLPLWVVAVFVASVAGIALALSVDGTLSRVALAVSANVALSVRFALAARGWPSSRGSRATRASAPSAGRSWEWLRSIWRYSSSY